MEGIKVKVPRLGEKYHLCWANRGCVWVLKFIGPDGSFILRTPKTNSRLDAAVKDLRHIKRNEINPH